MAYTVHVEPGNFQPAYNDLTFRVSCSDYGSTAFKYNFYTYVNGTLVNTTKLYPRPDGSCNFNPSSIIQQYISRYHQPTLATYKEGSSTTEVVKYKVVMKYEYETGGTLTEYSGNTGTDKYVWNGVADWVSAQSIATWVARYEPSTSTLGKAFNFIWNGESASNGILLNILDKRNITFMRRTAAGVNTAYSFDVYVSCRDGNHKQYNLTLPAITTNPGSYIFHMPIGITELNGITWSSTAIPSGKSSQINFDEDFGMLIRVMNVDGDPVSESYYFTFVEENCKYDHYTVEYQTSAGGYGYVNFDMKHFKQLNSEKSVYDKILPYSYDSTNRVSTVYGNLANEQITLNTDWIKEQDIVSEIKDMILSPELWLIDNAGVIIPVYIDKYTFQEMNVAQDKLTSYTVTFSEAFKKNTIR